MSLTRAQLPVRLTPLVGRETELGDIVDPTGIAGPSLTATAINNGGDVAGFYAQSSSKTDAFLRLRDGRFMHGFTWRPWHGPPVRVRLGGWAVVPGPFRILISSL